MMTRIPDGFDGSAISTGSTWKPRRYASRCGLSRAPTRATKLTGVPIEPSHTAWLAPEPPGRWVICARRSEPRTSGPSGSTMTSVITSPMTITRPALSFIC